MSNSDEHSPLLSENNDHLFTSREASSTTCTTSVSSQIMGRGRKFLVVICILLTELCERLTFYGVTANLLLFCSNELNLHAPWPSTISYLFTGLCFECNYTVKVVTWSPRWEVEVAAYKDFDHVRIKIFQV